MKDKIKEIGNFLDSYGMLQGLSNNKIFYHSSLFLYHSHMIQLRMKERVSQHYGILLCSIEITDDEIIVSFDGKDDRSSFLNVDDFKNFMKTNGNIYVDNIIEKWAL